MANELDKLVEKTKTQLKKGILEICILSIVSQEKGYSTEIIRKLSESKLIVKEGTVYPLLARLKNAGFLEYDWEESTSGPPRKSYSTTEKGDDFLKELLLSWGQLVNAVNQLTKNISIDE